MIRIHNIKTRKFYKELENQFEDIQIIKYTHKNYYSLGCEIKINEAIIEIEPMNFRYGLQWKINYKPGRASQLSNQVNMSFVVGRDILKTVKNYLNYEGS
jgi:hypothetical protein